MQDNRKEVKTSGIVFCCLTACLNKFSGSYCGPVNSMNFRDGVDLRTSPVQWYPLRTVVAMPFLIQIDYWPISTMAGVGVPLRRMQTAQYVTLVSITCISNSFRCLWGWCSWLASIGACSIWFCKYLIYAHLDSCQLAVANKVSTPAVHCMLQYVTVIIIPCNTQYINWAKRPLCQGFLVCRHYLSSCLLGVANCDSNNLRAQRFWREHTILAAVIPGPQEPLLD